MPLNSRAKCCVINYIAFPGTEHSFEFVYFPGPGVLKSKPSLQKYPIKLAFISTNAEKKFFLEAFEFDSNLRYKVRKYERSSDFNLSRKEIHTARGQKKHILIPHVDILLSCGVLETETV